MSRCSLALSGAGALPEREERRWDVVFANAGGGEFAALGEITPEHYADTFDTNVRGTLFTVQGALPLLNDGASIVLAGSTATLHGTPSFSVYGASKAALHSFTKTWAVELAGRGIRVNTLVPGAIATDFRRFMSEEFRTGFERDVIARVPLGRVGTADEAASVGLFLLSDDATYITASQYPVDGGLTRRLSRPQPCPSVPVGDPQTGSPAAVRGLAAGRREGA